MWSDRLKYLFFKKSQIVWATIFQPKDSADGLVVQDFERSHLKKKGSEVRRCGASGATSFRKRRGKKPVEWHV